MKERNLREPTERELIGYDLNCHPVYKGDLVKLTRVCDANADDWHELDEPPFPADYHHYRHCLECSLVLVEEAAS